MRLVKLSIFWLACAMLISLPISNLAQTKPAKKTTATTTNTSDAEISGGLKGALLKGISNAISSLGRENGFLGNLRVKIPSCPGQRPANCFPPSARNLGPDLLGAALHLHYTS